MDENLLTCNYTVSTSLATQINFIGFYNQLRDPFEFKKRIKNIRMGALYKLA